MTSLLAPPVARAALVGGHAYTNGADRSALVSLYAPALTNALARHLDEQTVLALHALAPLRSLVASDWGAVVGVTQPGHAALANTIARFPTEGPWCASPQVVPHSSLHAAAGIVSQMLRLHGPNLGVGGLLGRELDVLTTALTLLEMGTPGVVAVWTTASAAAAMALQPFADGVAALHLEPAPSDTAATFDPFALVAAPAGVWSAGALGQVVRTAEDYA